MLKVNRIVGRKLFLFRLFPLLEFNTAVKVHKPSPVLIASRGFNGMHSTPTIIKD